MNEYGGCLHFEILNNKIKSDGGYYNKYIAHKIDVDSGRSAIQYILESNDYNRIWLPVYNCPLVAERISAISRIKILWYNLNDDFTPNIKKSEFQEGDVLLWVNYYGVMFNSTIDAVTNIKKKSGVEIIIDNIPAYFSKPRMDVINIYSCRKFLGVPDGGHIIGGRVIPSQLPTYSTAENYLYLLNAIEEGSNAAYQKYQDSEQRFSNSKKAYGMPNLTKKVLDNVNYDNIKRKRYANFSTLNEILEKGNRLNFNEKSMTPSVYPYLTSNIKLRENLLERKIYVSRFWKHVLTNSLANAFEKELAEYLIPLPIDQRYDTGDMEYIANEVIKLEGK